MFVQDYMKFRPEWVDAELQVNSNHTEAAINDSKSHSTDDVTETLQQVKTLDDNVATITPTQAD